MSNILNVSGYRFVAIDEPDMLRTVLFDRARALNLLGTALLANEGINLFLAGAPEAIHEFLRGLRQDPRFADIDVKQSWSDSQPFRRLLVKVKREIIRMNQPAVQPSEGRAAALDPVILARWLGQGRDDEGREVVMLDTRNAFEVEHGRFEGALDWRLSRFSDFPLAFQQHRDELAGKAVVSYCTGGIRCEKAAIYMRNAGLPHVYQLEGGILKYFELAQGRHFRGKCFVFDERALLDSELQPALDATAA